MIVGIDKMYISEINAKNKVYNYYLYNLKKLETKNILISEKNYKDLRTGFTGYVYKKLIKM